MKKIILSIFIAILLIISTACASKSSTSTSNDKEKEIVVASTGSDAQVWQFIAKSDAAKEANLKIKVEEINDGLQLNEAVNGGKVDVNAFQSFSYFQDYVKQTNAEVTAFATTYLEPMGIYSEKYKSLEELPDGATIAIPNDTANTARALRLLKAAGLIQLSDSFDSFGSQNDITENKHKFKLTEVDAKTGPRLLPDVDAAVFGNSIALDAGLNSIKDSIYHEEVNQDTKANVNILVTQTKNADNKDILKLGEIYHTEEVQNFINEEFGGTKVPVQQSVESLAE